LAAKNHIPLEMLQLLMKHDAEIAMVPNNRGDLPLHFLLDKHFLFVNADLATAHGSRDSKQDAFDAHHTPEFREKVRDLAKQQTVLARISKFQLCGAIFAPTNGWTSEDDESTLNKSYDTMKKINLLAMAIFDHAPSLVSVGSVHGLNCLQIIIAFHAAPYKVIDDLLKTVPACAHTRSLKERYTALDLHCLRRNIPNEVRKEELDVSVYILLCVQFRISSQHKLTTPHTIVSLVIVVEGNQGAFVQYGNIPSRIHQWKRSDSDLSQGKGYD